MALEAANMAGHGRNGDPFDKYLRRCDLMLHSVMTGKDELLAFAISGNEGRGKVFVYELHVASAHRRRGFGRALLDLCEKASTTRGRTSPTLELQVHAANQGALSFYVSSGFVKMSELSNGSVYAMKRKR